MKKSTIILLIAAFLLVIVGLLACNLPRANASVIILNPISGQSIPAFLEYQVTSQIKPEGNWSRIELYINGELTRLDTPETNPGTFGLVLQPWIPTEEGPTMVEVKLYQRGNAPATTAQVAVMVKVMEEQEIPPTPNLTTPTPGSNPHRHNHTPRLQHVGSFAARHQHPGWDHPETWSAIHQNLEGAKQRHL